VVAQRRDGVAREAAEAEDGAVGVGLAQAWDDRVGAEGGHEDGGRHEHAREEPQVRVVARVEAAVAQGLAVGEEDQPARARHGQRTAPADQPAPGHELGALVVVGGHLRAQRAARHHVEREEQPDADGEGHEPGEELPLAQARGRREQGVEAQPHRDRREVHEGVPAPPARAEVVGDGADERVGDGVHAQGDEDREARERAGQPEHRGVVEDEEAVEGSVLGAVGDGADAVGDADREGDLAVVPGRLGGLGEGGVAQSTGSRRPGGCPWDGPDALLDRGGR
jgi:hypothetical protein